MANTIKLKNSAVAAKTPLLTDLVYGEVALNYADGKIYYKRSDNTIQSIGNGSTSSIDKKSYIATAGQTVFTLSYTAPYLEVFVNGVRLSSTDYTATNGTSVTLLVGSVAGDEVELMGFGASMNLTASVSTGKAIAMAMIFGG